MKRTKGKLSTQIKKHSTKVSTDPPEYDGSDSIVISTGSTLLDLAISGGRFHGGGIPAGIMIEIFGPSGCGKTVLLCEMAGTVQEKGGAVKFNDPEARLNSQFAKLFGLRIEEVDYSTPDTIPQVFASIRKWNKAGPNPSMCNGIFADSLAALSTDLEMGSEDGDKMGMRRAKEFSEELRKTCRILTKKNHLLVCSNQIRQKHNAKPFQEQYISPGGEAIAFYSSLRLKCGRPQKIKKEIEVNSKKVSRILGVETHIEVYKSSVWKPFRTAPLTITYDYGIDDIRQNLQFLKDFNPEYSSYQVRGEKMGQSMDRAIRRVEKHGMEIELKEEVIELWESIESRFEEERKPKREPR